jgi:hypothetical protein
MDGISWIASFPRSGVTWLRCMLTSYITGAPIDIFEDLQSNVPDLESMLQNADIPPFDAKRPVLVKTHYMADVPILGVYREATVKAVYLVRNPRDVLLSLIRMMGISQDDVESCRKVAEHFIVNEGSPGFPKSARPSGKALGSWPINVRTWTESAKERFPNADVLAMRYEDLRADPVGRFREIVEFLDIGRPVNLDDIRSAVERNTLERMREVEERGKVQAPGLMRGGAARKGLPFVGEGKHGQSLSFMGDDIEAAYRELLTGDSEFAYYAKQFGYAD